MEKHHEWRRLAMGAVAISLIATMLGLALVPWTRGAATDPWSVPQSATFSASGITVSLKSVTFGGTATVARIEASTTQPGERSIVNPQAVTITGFRDGPVILLGQNATGVLLRLPPVDTEASRQEIGIHHITLTRGPATEEVAGDWKLPVTLPAPSDFDEVFRVETLRPVSYAPARVELTAVRSHSETVITYTVPVDTDPLGPPETVAANGGAEYVAYELSGPRTVPEGREFTVSLPPSPFHETIQLRMGPFLKVNGGEGRSATVPVADLAGYTPSVAQATEVTVKVRPPAAATDLAVSEVQLLAKPDTGRAGGNLLMQVNAHLVTFAIVDGRTLLNPERYTSAFAVTDAKDRMIKVTSVVSWTGTPPSSDGTNPGMPAGSSLALLADEENDLSRISLTIMGAGDVIQPDGILSLGP